MKRIFGLVSVLLVLGLVGCAQLDAAKTKEGSLITPTKITVKIAADATPSAPLPSNPYIWAVGDLGGAAGGTVDFWSSKAKLVGQYGVAHTVVATNLSVNYWDSATDLDFKFVITSGDSAPAGGCEINNG
ncbi:MAG: hypothetical protein N2314_09255, partial [Brevinematales bacterium]|nr:hypothetical protein [Brevinematales bacterium]